MADSRYFELNDDVGVEPAHVLGKNGAAEPNPKAGELQPLAEFGLTINRPTMVDGEVIDSAESLTLDAIPGTRILKIDDPVVANAMTSHPLFHEIEAPSQKDLKDARKDTEAARTAGKE